MKKLFLLSAIALFFTGMVSAQDDSKMWLGGSLSITDDNSGSTFTIAPEFGYNLNSDWAVGGRLGIISESNKIGGSTTTASTTIFAPFARYTFIRGGNFSIFGQGEIPIVFGDAPNTVGIRALPGVSYSLNENFSIQALLPSVLALESGDNVTTFNFLSGGSAIGFVFKF